MSFLMSLEKQRVTGTSPLWWPRGLSSRSALASPSVTGPGGSGTRGPRADRARSACPKPGPGSVAYSPEWSRGHERPRSRGDLYFFKPTAFPSLAQIDAREEMSSRTPATKAECHLKRRSDPYIQGVHLSSPWTSVGGGGGRQREGEGEARHGPRNCGPEVLPHGTRGPETTDLKELCGKL